VKLINGESEYFTLGGLVLEQLQHLPQVGETLQLGAYHFTITSMEGRRIHQVSVRPIESDVTNEA
jgi:CBS domain containing-hemolysin-like protein